MVMVLVNVTVKVLVLVLVLVLVDSIAFPSKVRLTALDKILCPNLFRTS